MIKKIGIILSVIVLGILIMATRQPEEYRVDRSTTINASPAQVFPHLNDLHKWEPWSPWAKLDPNAKTTFDGPAAGVGAKMSWSGNRNVGEGSMTIIESHPPEHIRYQLDFVKPFPGTSASEFVLKPEGKQTLVTWSMYGKNNFMAKVISLFMSCDKMIGGQFEKGLASLKAVSEAPATVSGKKA